jgi:hypothetical protein
MTWITFPLVWTRCDVLEDTFGGSHLKSYTHGQVRWISWCNTLFDSSYQLLIRIMIQQRREWQHRPIMYHILYMYAVHVTITYRLAFRRRIWLHKPLLKSWQRYLILYGQYFLFHPTPILLNLVFVFEFRPSR